MVSRPKARWTLTHDPHIPDGAYELTVKSPQLWSFLREFGTHLWFIPASLPKDSAQVLISVEEEVGPEYRMCRYPWVLLTESAREQSLIRECPHWYVLNRADVVAFTDAPLF